MQVLREEEKPLEILPALPYIEGNKELQLQETENSVKQTEEKISDKNERKASRDRFLGRLRNQEPKLTLENPEQNTHIEDLQDEIQNTNDDVYSDYDGKRLMGWISEQLESIRSCINYCRKPPISDDSHENREIRKWIENYKKNTLFTDADSIYDGIEGLMWYAIGNNELFGKNNYLLDYTIQGYKEIYDQIMKCKGNSRKSDDALRWLGKLLICAARPLVVDELLVKDTEFEPSSGEGGVPFSGDYQDGE